VGCRNNNGFGPGSNPSAFACNDRKTNAPNIAIHRTQFLGREVHVFKSKDTGPDYSYSAVI